MGRSTVFAGSKNYEVEVNFQVLQKIFKVKFLRFLIISLFLVLPILYFVFSAMFFKPFEEKAGLFYDVVPANVDFFLNKVNLRDDFYEFPKPRLLEALERTAEWDSLTKSQYFRDLTGGRMPRDELAEVNKNLETIPIDLLSNVVGDEIALAGVRRGEGDLAWAALARVSRKVKFAYEAVSYSLVRSFLTLPFEYEVIDGQASFKMEDGSHLFALRHLDLIVVTNDEILLSSIEEAIDDYTKSLGYSNEFNEGVLKRRPPKSDREVFAFTADISKAIDAKKMAEDFGDSPELGIQVATSLFDPRFFERATGFLDLNSSASPRFQARISLDRTLVANSKTGVYSGNVVPYEELWGRMESLIPLEGTFFSMILNTGLRELFNIAERKMSDDTKQLINDGLLDALRYNPDIGFKSLGTLIDFLDKMLGDQILISLAEPGEWTNFIEGQQMGTSLPFPRIALIAPLNSPAQFAELYRWLPDIAAAHGTEKSFKIVWPPSSGNEFLEIPHTSAARLGIENFVCGKLSVDGEQFFVFTTSTKYYQWIIDVKLDHAPSLTEDSLYLDGRESIQGHGSGLLFFNSSIFGRMLDGLVEEMAKASTTPDWDSIRPSEREKLVASRGLKGKELDVEVEKSIEEELTSRLMRMESKWLSDEVPREAKRIRESFLWLELLRSAVLGIRAEEEVLEVAGGIVTAVRR